MGKIADKKKQKKEALLNSSFDLFTTKGFQKTSISDIVEKAKVAKGTFYLYFKDKYDVRNKLIYYKANILLDKAYKQSLEAGLTDLTDTIIFIADSIIDQFTQNTLLLKFIAKNLSWGVFKNVIIYPSEKSEFDFYEKYLSLLDKSSTKLKNPEVTLFMIIELISSCCYNSILFNQPVSIEKLKPYLYDTIKSIISSQQL